jgi:dUTP pyrophosphatase
MLFSSMELHIKKLHPDAKLPTYAHPGDAGMDLYVTREVTILPMELIQVETGVAMAIPYGYVGLVWDKSGLSNKFGLKVMGGVFDTGYRGEILVGILNTSQNPYTFHVGDKVAQMLIQEVTQPTLIEVAELDDTVRGEGRFGSTGV